MCSDAMVYSSFEFKKMKDVMRQLVSVLGLAIFAMSQAQAELIINGQSVTTTANPIMSNSQSSYSSQNNFQNC